MPFAISFLPRCPARCRHRALWAGALLLAGAWATSPALAAEAAPREDRQSGQPADIEAPGGFRIETDVVGISQRVNGAGSPDGNAHMRTNSRADVFLSLGAGRIGAASGVVSAQLRAGAGRGVGVIPTFASVNATSFDPEDGASRSYGTVAQFYYELELPVGQVDPPGTPRPSLKLAVGKLDVFNFFDQNRVSSNEDVNFIHNAFVHSPLLDAGNDVASDQYGYQPGLRLKYFDAASRLRWGASLGVFATGSAADFHSAPRGPLVIAQFEAAPRQAQGRPFDNYRLYVWSDGRTTDFAGEREQRHTGIGVSADQRVGRDWNFFERLGRRMSGDGEFNTGVTIGAELEGRRWGRSKDAIGLAFGWLETSAAFRRFTSDGLQLGYVAGGAERITELYYRFEVNQWLQISPDLQRIERAAGNPGAPNVTLFGLRARVTF